VNAPLAVDDLDGLTVNTLVGVASMLATHRYATGHDEALLAALRQCYRDIYAETVDATGIDPCREADAARTSAWAQAAMPR
jgi:hypothetical protein